MFNDVSSYYIIWKVIELLISQTQTDSVVFFSFVSVIERPDFKVRLWNMKIISPCRNGNPIVPLQRVVAGRTGVRRGVLEALVRGREVDNFFIARRFARQ